ncbi:MAG: sulfurtransferase-like selenium metabolism protein YedF [Bacillota bacterium]
MVEIEKRGPAFPEPVVKTCNVPERMENRERDYACMVEQQGSEYRIPINKGEPLQGLTMERRIDSVAAGKTYLISSNRLGQGSEELGHLLMQNILYMLSVQKPTPSVIICINSGVYLATESSPALEHLERLVKGGTEILSCGTSLDYYRVKEKLAVGRITNIYEIIERLSGDEVVTLA